MILKIRTPLYCSVLLQYMNAQLSIIDTTFAWPWTTRILNYVSCCPLVPHTDDDTMPGLHVGESPVTGDHAFLPKYAHQNYCGSTHPLFLLFLLKLEGLRLGSRNGGIQVIDYTGV